MSSSPDPMGVSGVATIEAPAESDTKPPRVPRKPDDNAPRRKTFVTQLFAEARKANPGDEAAATLVAVKRLLKEDAKGDRERYKSVDFADESVGKKKYFDYKIEYFEMRKQEFIALRDGTKGASPKSVAQRAAKIKANIAKLAEEIRKMGLDPAAVGLDFNFSA